MFALPLVAALAVLAGCSSVAPRFTDMTASYSEAVQQHDRNQLLANMLLASRNLPLQFTAVPSVIGTGSITTGAHLGVEVYGPGDSSWGRYFVPRPGSFGSFGGSLATSREFNFTLSSLDNEQFARGFLSNVSVDNIHAFTSTKDVPVRLKYLLFFESLTVNPRSASEMVFRNGPNPVDAERFQVALDRARAAGLRTEVTTVTRPIGPPINREEAVQITQALVQRDDETLAIRKTDLPEPNQYQVVASNQVTRFCFDQYVNQRDARLTVAPDLWCGRKEAGNGIAVDQVEEHEEAPAPDADVAAKFHIDSVAFNIRSTLDIFRYLGAVIGAQLRPDNPWLAKVRTRVDADRWQERPLLVVRKGDPPSGTPVIAVARLFDETYYVPLDDESYSSLVFQIASIVITVSKVPGSIPNSPGVLIK